MSFSGPAIFLETHSFPLFNTDKSIQTKAETETIHLTKSFRPKHTDQCMRTNRKKNSGQSYALTNVDNLTNTNKSIQTKAKTETISLRKSFGLHTTSKTWSLKNVSVSVSRVETETLPKKKKTLILEKRKAPERLLISHEILIWQESYATRSPILASSPAHA